MRCASPEQGTSRLAFEQEIAEKSGRAKSGQTKTCERKRMPRPMQHRLQEFRRENIPVTHQRPEQSGISARIRSKAGRGFSEIPMQTDGNAIVQGMGEGKIGMNPRESKMAQRKCVEKRRTGR